MSKTAREPRLYYDTFRVPTGYFSVATNGEGNVLATAFGDEARLRTRALLPRMIRDKDATAAVRAQILAYFAGERRDFDLVLAAPGTTFQKKVWAALTKIPFGETRTYSGLATTLGKPSASRAVGGANGANPICLIVPCHRVIGADGSLTGFAFGEAIKRTLLQHEGALT